MRFRKLRIAWSVVCGLACVLLIALWVRSYWYTDDLAFRSIVAGRLTFFSNKGEMWLYWHADTLLRVIDFGSISTKYDPGFPPTSLGFGFIRDDDLDDGLDYWGIGFPQWFLSLICVAGIAIPWLPWWSKRFSLRTLLIATTFVAVVLGGIVWAVR
jgi:hypothetical protein